MALSQCARLNIFYISLVAGICGCSDGQLSPGITTPTPPSYAKGPNAENAKLCQKGGWTTMYASLTWQAFLSEEECTGYGAEGGSYLTLMLSNGRYSDGFFLIDAYFTGFPLRTSLAIGPVNYYIGSGDELDENVFALDCPSSYAIAYLTATSPDGRFRLTSNGVPVGCPE